MTRNSNPQSHARSRRSSFPLALAALAGLMAATGSLRAEKPREITTPLCDGEAKCSLLRLEAEAIVSKTLDSPDTTSATVYVDRLQLYFNGTCRYELTDGGMEEVNDFTVYEVEPGYTEFTRGWRVPAGCEYSIHARVQTDFGKDNIFRIDLSKTDTAQDLCFSYDLGDHPARTDIDCN